MVKIEDLKESIDELVSAVKAVEAKVQAINTGATEGGVTDESIQKFKEQVTAAISTLQAAIQ